MKQRTPLRKISAKRLAELGGKVPFSTIRKRGKLKRKSKGCLASRVVPKRPVPGALDPRSYITKGGRGELYT